MVLLVTVFLGISAASAADIDVNTTAASNLNDNVVGNVTDSYTSIESNSIENKVSNEYETITNENSSNDIKKQSTTDITSNTKTSTNNKREITITTKNLTAYAEQVLPLSFKVTYLNGEKLASAKTAIKINGKTIASPRVVNGTVYYNYTIPKFRAQTYNMTIIVGETSNSLKAQENFTLKIIRHNIVISMSSISAFPAETATLKATVKYDNGTVANGTKAVFKINGKTIGSTTVKNGVVSLSYVVPTKAASYPLILKIGESTVNNYNDKTVNLTVKKLSPTISTDSLFVVQKGKSITLTAKITGTGKVNATGKVSFKINGKTIATVKLANNKASYTYSSSPLKVGLHTVSIVYGGTNSLNGVRYNTSLRVENSTVYKYSYSDVLKKANSTVEFVSKNKRLPNYLTMGNNQVLMPDFLFMLSQVMTYNDTFYGASFSQPNSNTKTSEYDVKVSMEDYQQLAKDIFNSYINAGKAPNTIKTQSGLTLSFNDSVYVLSRAISFLGRENRFPNFVSVEKINPTSSSSTSGSSSGTNHNVDTSTSAYVSTNKVPTGFEAYVAAAENADVNTNVIKNAVKKAVSGVSGTYNQAVAIYNYVNKVTDYSSYLNTRYGAIGTLNRGYGNCVDQAHLLLGMYRTANIPARYCHATCYFRSGLVIGHVWVEVYVGGKWYSCDTTSNQNSFDHIENWKTSSTVKRYYSLYF